MNNKTIRNIDLLAHLFIALILTLVSGIFFFLLSWVNYYISSFFYDISLIKWIIVMGVFWFSTFIVKWAVK